MSNKLFLTNLAWYNLNTMASGQTPTYLLPYPLSTDPVDIHGDIFDLADRLEDVISGFSSLPSQSGNNGKFLTTSGSAASWATIPETSQSTPSTLGTVYGFTDRIIPSASNASIGYGSLVSVTTGAQNAALGTQALCSLTEGVGNTALGANALFEVTTGYANIGIGNYANFSTTDGYSNIGIGYMTLGSLVSGNNNIVIGTNAAAIPGSALLNGTNNIVIGTGALTSSDSSSNEITIGHTSNSRFRLPGLELDWQYVISEETTIFASAPTATTNHDVMTSRNISYYTSNTANNWILNIRGDGSTTYNSISSIGKSTTFVFMATNGATAYYPTALNIDGTPRTVKWQGGTAPTAGNVSSIDVYTYTVIKTAASTYTVLGSQTKFA